jgi:hypothetical protein
MLIRFVRPVFLFVVTFLLTAGVARAQETGTITGVISDSTGGVLDGARVKATNVATAGVRVVESSSSGTYVLSSLAVGQYTLEVSKSGFKTLRQQNVVIDINSALTLNLSMSVGSVNEEVTVTGTPPIIDSENQELGNYRFAEQLQNLPIIVREVQTLVGQTPGVPYGTGGKVASDTDTVGGTYNPGGSSRSAMVVLSDGTQLNSFQTTGYPAIDGIQRRADLPVPNIDTVSQFKLVTNGASAEYVSPVAIIIATKSGTNAFHGSAYDFYQSGGLSAHVWSIAQPQSYVRQQFGGSVTGPILRDKLFFAAAAEAFSFVQVSNTNVRWPTAAEASGDLSSLSDPTQIKTPEFIYDPKTGQPFPGNKIPTTRISPVSAALLALFPTAPKPATLTGFNAVSSKPEYDKSQKYDGRLDWDPNASNLIFGRTTIGHISQSSVFKGTVPGDYGFSVKNYYTQVYTVSWTHILNPSSLFKITFSRRSEPFQNTPTHGDTTFSVPIQNLTPAPPFAGPPAVTNGTGGSGISDLADRNFLNFSQDNDYQLSPSFQKTIGKHTLGAGLFFLHGHKTAQLAAPPWGQYTTASNFNTSATKYTSSATSATGDSFGDFLVGLPGSTNVTVGPAGGFLAKTTWSLWVQDDWKITQNLTLNFGLRYDNFGFFYPTDGRGSNSDFATGQIVIPNGSQSLIQPAFQPFSSLFITTSAAGVSKSFTHPVNVAFAPRIGFAYRFQPTFVLRGGFGIYDNDFNESAFSNQINNPPFTYQAKLTRALLISNGVDVNTQYTFQNPTANGSPAAAASVLGGFAGFDSHYPVQTAYEYNLTLAKQFGNYAITASYVGNLGHHLDRQVLVNACPPGPTLCSVLGAGAAGSRKWSQFGTTFGQNTGAGTSNYNAGNIEASRHFSNGILLDANYSYSKLLSYQYIATNPVVSPNWQYDYGPVSQQPYQVFHFNHVYELPFGRGKRFGGNLNAVASNLIGGWKISGVGTWQAGQQLTVLAGTGNSPTGATSNRANRTCSGGISNKTLGKWFDTSCYSVPSLISASAPSPTQQFGTAGIGTVIGPRWFSYDANIQKPFRILDRATLALRVDAINVFNHPNYATPDVTVSDGAVFGQIRSASTNYIPRAFQFGARLDF